MRARSLIAVVAVATALLLAGCSSGDDDDTAKDGATREQTSSAAADADGRTIIDVRTAQEFDGGHLKAAINIDVSATTFQAKIAELPKDGKYLVYCRSGNRSAAATTAMQNLGFTDVVDGGAMDALLDAGLPAA